MLVLLLFSAVVLIGCGGQPASQEIITTDVDMATAPDLSRAPAVDLATASDMAHAPADLTEEGLQDLGTPPADMTSPADMTAPCTPTFSSCTSATHCCATDGQLPPMQASDVIPYCDPSSNTCAIQWDERDQCTGAMFRTCTVTESSGTSCSACGF